MKDLYENEIPEYQKEWQKKERGQAVAACNHSLLIKKARDHAIRHAVMNGEVNIEDVRERMIADGYDLSGRVRWLGSVFKSKEFEHAGYTKATHKGSHCRTIMIWKLKK